MNRTKSRRVTNQLCATLLLGCGIDPVQFAATLQNQQAYNGNQSTITKSEAAVGIPGPGDTVAQGFRSNQGVHAAASLNGTDVYFRSGGFLSGLFGNRNIGESTIEHEGLHNFLKLYDPELQTRLGAPQNPYDTTNINQELKDHHCTQ